MDGHSTSLQAPVKVTKGLSAVSFGHDMAAMAPQFGKAAARLQPVWTCLDKWMHDVHTILTYSHLQNAVES